MGIYVRVVLGLLALAAFATPALAQGTYVSASVTGDITRFSRSTSDGGTDLSGSGEAIGFALRLGTPIGASWGVEAEFARPSEIRQDGQPDFITLPTSLTWVSTAPSGSVASNPAGNTVSGLYDLFPFGYRFKTSRRTTTFSTSAWARQTFTSRVSLVYLGGLGFARTSHTSEVTFDFDIGPIPVLPGIRPTILPPRQTKFVQYGVHPLAGLDARIGLTDHVELVPAVRLMGLESGWLFRPSVGLGWVF